MSYHINNIAIGFQSLAIRPLGQYWLIRHVTLNFAINNSLATNALLAFASLADVNNVAFCYNFGYGLPSLSRFQFGCCLRPARHDAWHPLLVTGCHATMLRHNIFWLTLRIHTCHAISCRYFLLSLLAFIVDTTIPSLISRRRLNNALVSHRSRMDMPCPCHIGSFLHYWSLASLPPSFFIPLYHYNTVVTLSSLSSISHAAGCRHWLLLLHYAVCGYAATYAIRHTIATTHTSYCAIALPLHAISHMPPIFCLYCCWLLVMKTPYAISPPLLGSSRLVSSLSYHAIPGLIAIVIIYVVGVTTIIILSRLPLLLLLPLLRHHIAVTATFQ